MSVRRFLWFLTWFASVLPALGQAVTGIAKAKAPATANWAEYMPAVAAMANAEWPNEKHLEPQVLDEKRFSGIPTALIDIGCCGAYVDDIYVIQIRNGRAVRASIQPQKNAGSPEFAQGASTMHGRDVAYLMKWNAIVATSWDDVLDEKGTVAECRKDTYVWNPAKTQFEWNRRLSYHRHKPRCGIFGDNL